MEFRKTRGRRAVLGLFLVGPPALYEVREGDTTTTVVSDQLAAALGASGRDYQEAHMLAAHLFDAGDPSWVQWPYGGVVRD
ncbi:MULTISPECIES: hypothetical protein [unclassified Curtobacterium]|uniref:hypothetical protein n=1 Tax=unclassified Curtobacterium TaxID=257496 RepID=UPI0008DE7914|nr:MULTISPECIES: hypothetical protein [unclassified Curtobacterium]OIH98575.1 hypothetical protein BIU92_12555 [Curtobacterium sp. MCBA15_003]OII12755.1 hypothetical protein BIU97_02015 [Curtobacterium sp. MCBA15_009]OII32300.1 hypothetical protein BIU94_02885 [Curtobacterium sp. MMLR14_006]WIE63342.1 hypothetical protein DEI99_008640 [Curtobacterium sp. MCLR17_036]